MRLINWILLFMLITQTKSIQGLSINKNKETSFLVCYGKLDPNAIKGYGCLILEGAHYTSEDIKIFKKNNKKVLAYISLGEVHPSVCYFKKIRPYTFGGNKIWNGKYLDIAKPEAKNILVDAMSVLLDKGFEGLFIDNMDNYTIYGPMLEQRRHLIKLLKIMKEEFPKAFFIQNSGMLLLKETAPFVNALAIESLATDYNFKNKAYRLRDNKAFLIRKQNIIQSVSNIDIPVFVIEYADTPSLYYEVKERLECSAWNYFVAPIDLQTILNF